MKTLDKILPPHPPHSPHPPHPPHPSPPFPKQKRDLETLPLLFFLQII
ncbi:MAG: hypothetical protein F6K40_21990 [Okeania sp. SIO3I5]|nr:hypothetical protein [Okeania sp. SIO3I5]NEQ38794.1 hypothetical protein [Okeania sp. SIO3I5]